MFENVFIVSRIEVPMVLLANMLGSGDVPLQDVRILVLDVFTKHPRSAPCDCKVLHRNSMSGRNTFREDSGSPE